MTDSAKPKRRPPHCPQCGSTKLSVIETHAGVGGWPYGEWSLNDNGNLVTFGEGWSGSMPTGRNLFECEDCGHEWRIRGRSLVAERTGGSNGTS